MGHPCRWTAAGTPWLDLPSERRRLPARALLYRHRRPWLAICETPFCLSGGDQDEELLELSVLAREALIVKTIMIRWEEHDA